MNATGTGWFSNLLDRSIVRSFDASGFIRHAKAFDSSDLEVDLSGRVCLVTGANSGLGFATTVALANRGATVWMLCRNPQRGEEAQKRIQGITGSTNLHLAQVDLSSLQSIASFAADFSEKEIHVLVHNAGVLPAERSITADDLELTLATNLVGPFALTAHLWPRMKTAERARIIWVSSGGMYGKKLDLNKLEGVSGRFDGVAQYAYTKRAMSVLNEQMARRLAPHGIASHCMHPGWAETPGVQTSIPRFWKLTQKILRTSEQGADTIVWLAACDKAQSQSGLFWFDRQAVSTHLGSWSRTNPENEAALWPKLIGWAGVDAKGFPAPTSR